MKERVSKILLIFGFILIVELIGLSWSFSENRDLRLNQEMLQGGNFISNALNELGTEKGNGNLLCITNAGYGTLKGQTTEAFLDLFSNMTGCSMGTRSFLAIQTSYVDPLWCALYRKDHRRLIFIKWCETTFKVQKVDLAYDKIYQPENWKTNASGIIGGNNLLFSLVSISSSWSENASWTHLKAAGFHNHYCPGVEVGYLIAQYLKNNLPLREGERYFFMGAPPYCPMDVLQVLFDATPGKQMVFSKTIDPKKIEKYSGDLWFDNPPLPPLIAIALRVNAKSNICQGVVLGMDYKSLFNDIGENYLDFNPLGGKSNPIYHIARVRVASKMVSMNMAEKLRYIKEVKSFSGPAALTQKIAREGTDPYAIIWDLK